MTLSPWVVAWVVTAALLPLAQRTSSARSRFSIGVSWAFTTIFVIVPIGRGSQAASTSSSRSTAVSRRTSAAR